MITPWLTLALVLITAYYAWQTHQTVKEMRAARAAAETPHLALTVENNRAGDPGAPVFGIKNLGPGPAVHVALELGNDPGDERWSFSVPLIEAGRRLVSTPPALTNVNISKYPQPCTLWARGEYRSVSGTVRRIDESLNLREAFCAISRTAAQDHQHGT